MEALNPLNLGTLLRPDWALFALGVVLLLCGRRLVWLALAGLGCMLGLALADRLLIPSAATSPWVQLGLMALFALGGALLALFAQKMAVAVAGFVLGVLGSLWLLQALGYAEEPWTLFAVLGGAALGFLLGRFLFAVALTVLSAAIGASLILEPFTLAADFRPFMFLGLSALGVLIQSRGRRRSARL